MRENEEQERMTLRCHVPTGELSRGWRNVLRMEKGKQVLGEDHWTKEEPFGRRGR